MNDDLANGSGAMAENCSNLINRNEENKYRTAEISGLRLTNS
ncbi:MAG: hypothetical protein OEM01_08385 [Desulfobulbaceae bacterium]|nr:hypothetical protein [Desulfobulbaceae bacterium]